MKTEKEIEVEITKKELEIKDWAGRVYKTSNLTVTDWRTDGDIYYKLSVDCINERKRKNRIEGAKEEIEMLKGDLNYIVNLRKENKRKEDLILTKCRPTFMIWAEKDSIIFEEEKENESFDDLFSNLFENSEIDCIKIKEDNDFLLEDWKSKNPAKVNQIIKFFNDLENSN